MSNKLTPDQREKVSALIDAAQDDLEGVIFNLVAELAAMTARAELAERQVEILRMGLENAACRMHTALVPQSRGGLSLEELYDHLLNGGDVATKALAEAGKQAEAFNCSGN
jgi:hypothetical protein